MGSNQSSTSSASNIDEESAVSAFVVGDDRVCTKPRQLRRRRAYTLWLARKDKQPKKGLSGVKKRDSLRDTMATEPPSYRFSSVHFSRIWMRNSTAVPLEPTQTTPATLVVQLSYQLQKNPNEELGYFSFQCNSLEDALSKARLSGKPVFCVEALIPGDVDAGDDVFSHPLLLEAAESLFITVRPEEKAFQLQRSGSGRPCCTTVGFLNKDGEPLASILGSEGLTLSAVVQSMIEALKAHDESFIIPSYFQLLEEETVAKLEMAPNPTKRRFRNAFFGMKDAATGEIELAGLEGVLTTRSGVVKGQGVVEVGYDSQKVQFGKVMAHAIQHNICDRVYVQTNDERVAAIMEVSRVRAKTIVTKHCGEIGLYHDPKSALRRTPMRFVPMTEVQATRANRLIHLGKFNEAMRLLSPWQGLILMQAMRSSSAQKEMFDVVELPVLSGWISVCTKQLPKRSVDLSVESENTHEQ